MWCGVCGVGWVDHRVRKMVRTVPAGWAWRKFYMEGDKHIGDNQVGHSDEFHDHDIEEYRSNIHNRPQHKISSSSNRD